MTHASRLGTWLVLALLTACGGGGLGGGCGGGTPTTYPNPPPAAGEVFPSVMAVRIEQGALDFITTHLSDVLRATYPTRVVGGIERASAYLPEQSFDMSLFSVDVRDGCIGSAPVASCAASNRTFASMLELNLDTIDQSMHARFEEGGPGAPDAIFISVRDFDLFVDVAVAFGAAACRLHDDDPTKAAIHIEHLDFRLTLQIDAQGKLHADVTDVVMEVGAFNEASLLNVAVDACDDATCTDPDCGGTCSTWCSVGGFFFESLEFLADLLSPIVNAMAPQLAQAIAGPVLRSLDDESLVSTQRIDVAAQEGGVGALMADATALVTTTRPGPDGFRVTPAFAGPGMSLLMDGGAFGELSRCAPTVRLPDFDAGYAGPPTFNGRVRVGGRDESYHFAFSLSEAFADQLAYGLFQMGGMCFTAGTDTLGGLSGGALTVDILTLIAPQLAEIAEPGAPVLFQVHPSRAPAVTFGGGSATAGAEADIDDALVQIDFGELGISIYTLVDESMVRLATIVADVRVGASIVRAPDNKLEIGVDGLEVKNLAQVYNELAPDTDFATLFDSLISVALGQLLESAGGFEVDPAPMVSDALGGAPIYGRINDVRREAGTLGYLSVYFTLCDADDIADASNTACYSPSSPAPRALRQLEPVRLIPAPGRRFGAATPLRLAVDDAYDYQVRVDGVSWSGVMRPRAGVLEVRHALLGLPGRHSIELRAQRRGAYFTRADLGEKLLVDVR